MRNMGAWTLAATLGAGLTIGLTAGEPPAGPQPQKEHRWLQQLEGDWKTETQVVVSPGEPLLRSEGTETVRMIGGFWALCQVEGAVQGSPFSGVFTLGFDPEQEQYVGTWVDSMSSHLWRYEGTRDASGQALTLYSEGPCPQEQGKLVKVRAVLEIVDPDHRLFTSERLENGHWVRDMTVRYTRAPAARMDQRPQ